MNLIIKTYTTTNVAYPNKIIDLYS